MRPPIQAGSDRCRQTGEEQITGYAYTAYQWTCHAQSDHLCVSELNLNLGGCDFNPKAEGYRLAREMGIYICHDFRDLFELRNLDGIIELTNDHSLLLKPIEHHSNMELQGINATPQKSNAGAETLRTDEIYIYLSVFIILS